MAIPILVKQLLEVIEGYGSIGEPTGPTNADTQWPQAGGLKVPISVHRAVLSQKLSTQ